MFDQIRYLWLVLAMVLVVAVVHAADELKCIQKPTFWIVGQQTRIMIETPADCGKLEVTYPEALELFDRWPHQAGATVQRFYFRAHKPFEAGEISFKSGDYQLTLPAKVLSWQQVLTDKFEDGGMTLPRIFPLAGQDEHKSGLTFFTGEELADVRQQGVAGLGGQSVADKLLAETPEDEQLFYALPETAIPRAVYVNRWPMKGCPICGTKVFEGRSAFYPWNHDFENRPYKVQCPECLRWFPSNDFAAGDMTSGEFPDDGWGYFDEEGDPYGFIAYHGNQFYRGRYKYLPYTYSRFWAATGDKRFGRAAAIILFRIAEQYLNLALNINQRKGYTRQAIWRGKIVPQGTPHLRGSYMYFEGPWECGLPEQYAQAFERIWDYFEEEDPEFLKLLQDNYHPEIQTMQAARNFIETGYFRVAAQNVMDGGMRANRPGDQMAAMNIALFLNSPRSIEIVDWTFNRAGGMRYFLTNEFFVDGSAFESPGYNAGHYRCTQGIADLLDRIMVLRPQQYEDAGFPRLSDDPKFKYMYDHNINYTLIGRTYANIGDDGDLAYTDPLPLKAGASLHSWVWIPALKTFPDEANYAKAVWDSEKNAPIRQLTDPALRARVTQIVKREGADLDLPSQVLDGYSHVILRSGKGENKRALWMRYGQAFGHVHYDTLTIGYEALRRTLLPELGYYRGEDFRSNWDMNWCIHYMTKIMGEPERPEVRGPAALIEFVDGGWAQTATAAIRRYKNTDPPQIYRMINDGGLQQRTVALVDLSPEHSYAVSIFRLRGGTDHYWSFHGPRGTAESSGLELIPQERGTLAGPDVAYGDREEWMLKHGKDGKPDWIHLSCFPYLYDVHRGKARGIWNLEWDLENYPDIHVRMHAVQPVGADVALCKGKPAGGGKPYELQWAVQQTSGREPLATQFATVIEVYEGEPLISEIRRLDVMTEDAGDQPPVAFEVICGDRTDTIIHCQDAAIPVTTSSGVTMQGCFGIWSEEQGEVQRVLLTSGTRIARGDRQYSLPAAAWSGEITAVNFAEFKVVVSAKHEQPELLVGRYARITNDRGNEATHLIVAARPVSEGVELALDLDPRIGEGPVSEIHEDGITSGVKLAFGAYLYYKGKTLCNEANSVMYKLNGVRSSRVYINTELHGDASRGKLSAEFVDTDGDDITRFTIYNYGPGDTVRVPNSLSTHKASDQ